MMVSDGLNVRKGVENVVIICELRTADCSFRTEKGKQILHSKRPLPSYTIPTKWLGEEQ